MAIVRATRLHNFLETGNNNRIEIDTAKQFLVTILQMTATTTTAAISILSSFRNAMHVHCIFYPCSSPPSSCMGVVSDWRNSGFCFVVPWKIFTILFFIQSPSVGRRKKPPTLGLRPRYYSARSDTSDRRLEALNLPPTKVEEKRSKLQRLYERKEKKRAENLLRQAKEKEDAMGHPEPLHEVSDYEKNKLKIAKSNIQFELPTLGTDRSTQPSATQRGTK